MQRLTVLAVGLLFGCQPTSATPIASVQNTSLPSNTGFPEPAEFTSWTSVTIKPVHIGPVTMALCRNLTPEEEAARKEAENKHGPHSQFTIQVRVNAIGLESLRKNKLMPVGSVVVKEKYQGNQPLRAYALMIKREPGYDAEHHDWQYVYVDAFAETAVSEGRLSHCIQCHQGAKDTDYLFKFYVNEGNKEPPG